MLTMFIPAYNEQSIIRENALRAARALRSASDEVGVPARLVVLDDGSTDQTAAEARRAAELDPSIGYQWAAGPSRRENLVRAMLDADTPFVGWMDADLSTSLDDLHNLIASSLRYDIVSGSRYLPSSVIDRTLKRLVISRSYNGLVRFLYGSRVQDHWCGFKIFDRSALGRITEHIGVGIPERQMFWDAQMWVCAQRLGLRILELPVHWREGEKSALRLHTELPMIRYTFEYWASGKWRRAGSAGDPARPVDPAVARRRDTLVTGGEPQWLPEGIRPGEVEVFGSNMAFVRGGAGPTLLFLHGNPTSSFLWRGVLRRLAGSYDCVAADLIGMGRSGKPDLDYGFADHARFLEAFVDRLDLRAVTIVGHDWGAVLGLDLLRRRPDVVARIAVCEGHLRPFGSWAEMDEGSASLFSPLRTPGVGERLVMEENLFVEHVLPGGMNRVLSPEEWAVYREPYPTPASRRPILRWAQQIPVGRDPANVHEAVIANQSALLRASVPRLLLYGSPGAVVGADVVAWCRAESAGLELADIGEGIHFLPEDQPAAIADALRSWLAATG